MTKIQSTPIKLDAAIRSVNKVRRTQPVDAIPFPELENLFSEKKAVDPLETPQMVNKIMSIIMPHVAMSSALLFVQRRQLLERLAETLEHKMTFGGEDSIQEGSTLALRHELQNLKLLLHGAEGVKTKNGQ